MSVLHRLWRITKAYAESRPEHVEEELRKWEEEVAERIKKQNRTKRGPEQKPSRARAEDIADAFRALEVEVGADFETCKKAYRALAKKYYPDLWPDPEKNEIAKKVFQLIGEAYARIKKFYRIT